MEHLTHHYGWTPYIGQLPLGQLIPSVSPSKEPTMSSSENITTLTDSTFDEHVGAASTTVVVDFWAEWCGPCKMIAPILDEISQEQIGRLGIAKLNVDENPNIAMRYQVQSIPTMLVFKAQCPRES
jgi:thioredoxin 1